MAERIIDKHTDEKQIWFADAPAFVTALTSSDGETEIQKKQRERAAHRPIVDQAAHLDDLYRNFGKGGVVNADFEKKNPLRDGLRETISKQKPVQMILFWGAGEKAAIGQSEEKFGRRIQEMLNMTADQYKFGVELTIIFADVHAINNGYGDWGNLRLAPPAQKYYGEVYDFLANMQRQYQEIGSRITLRAVDLSQLYRDAGESLIPPEPLAADDPAFVKNQERLVQSASAHNRSYPNDPELAAREYAALRLREKRLLATLVEQFPGLILVAPGGKRGAKDLIVPDGMAGIFLGGVAPWFEENALQK